LTRNLMTLEQSNENLNDELCRLGEINHSGLGEKSALNQKLEARFWELADITRILMQHETMLGQKSQQLFVLQKLAKGWLKDAVWKHRIQHPFGKADKYRQQRERILLSGLFDAEWYLKKYPDVVKSGKDPVVHYLRYGAAENRDPSPVFSTYNYRSANSKALDEGINPLLHFIDTEAQKVFADK